MKFEKVFCEHAIPCGAILHTSSIYLLLIKWLYILIDNMHVWNFYLIFLETLNKSPLIFGFKFYMRMLYCLKCFISIANQFSNTCSKDTINMWIIIAITDLLERLISFIIYFIHCSSISLFIFKFLLSEFLFLLEYCEMNTFESVI